MRGKKGTLRALYLVTLTLLMVGLVFYFYVSHNKALSVSLVSPLAVLEIRDDLSYFEMSERELIRASLNNVGMDKDKFKDEFISDLSVDMEDFIFEDLFWNGQAMKGNFDKDAFLENVLYSVSEDSRGLILKRAEIGKRFLLKANDKADVDFPVDAQFDFSVEYLIVKNNNKFIVERV